MTEEASAEAVRLLNSREYYVNTSGKLIFPVDNLITELTLATLTE